MADVPPAPIPRAPWGKPWFLPKRFGIGSGLPCSWEGWVTLAIFLAAMVGGSVAMKPRTRPEVAAALVIGIIAVFCVIAWGRTSGGWRWRSGRDVDR